MNFVLAFVLIFAQQTWKPTDPKTFCRDAKDKKLCTELLSIRDRDQEVRSRWIADIKNEALKTEVGKVDDTNLARIEQIIAKGGWPGPSRVGKSAGSVAWLVIQHAELAIQKKYLDMMTKAADTGELDPGLLATTVDRIRVREGRPQLYGTQFHEMNGVQVPQAIEDEANVDARRAKAGMGSLADYATDLGRTYGKAAAASPVIARVWRGRVSNARAEEYSKYLYDNGIVKIRGIAGNLGAQMLRRAEGDTTEFMVISYWPSRAAIKAFAGEDIEKVHFLPRDREFLINPDETVRHYEVSAEEWAAAKK
jgi:heme-degrading monooxygenase HmoA